MKKVSYLPKCAFLALMGMLHIGAASAQNLSAYTELSSNLDKLYTTAGSSPSESLIQLDNADKSLAKLAPTLSNHTLLDGLSSTLLNARAAQSRSPYELKAHASIAKGILRKSLYDQTSSALVHSKSVGISDLNILATDIGLNTEVVSDAKSGNLALVDWKIQKHVLQKIKSELRQVSENYSSNSYLSLVNATSWFTIIQDSSVFSNLNVKMFESALNQLVSGQKSEFSSSLININKRLDSADLALSSLKKTVSSKVSAALVEPVKRPPVKPVLPDNSQDKLFAGLAKALAAASVSDMSLSRKILADLPLNTSAKYQDFNSKVSALSKRSGIAPLDIQSLILDLGKLENQQGLESNGAMLGFYGTSSNLLGGWAGAILSLIAAVACIGPLYFMNMAFGSNYKHWKIIFTALLVMCAPIFISGISSFIGIIGDSLNIPALRLVNNISLAKDLPFTNITNLVSLLLATYGFRGLCAKFGLLNAKPRKPSKPNLGPDKTSLDWDEDFE